MFTSARQVLAVLVTAILACRALGDHAQQVERLVQPLVDARALAGCAVGVIDGDAREVHGYGEVTLGGGQKPDGRTIYEIGSVTKSFTGVLLVDMAARGEVTLDQRIAELVPDGVTPPEFAGFPPITLQHLATHTSGLPRLPDNMAPKDPNNPYADYTPELMYAFLNKHKLRRGPGTFEYSNFGAGLLGALLARRAGKSYEELVTERIAAPLEMDDTRATLTPEQAARFAPPYDRALNPNFRWETGALSGAGALRSTADDMLKFVAAALDEDDKAVGAAIRTAWEKRIGEPGVGTGWFVAGDGVSRWHNGETGGYSAAVFVYPPQRKAVVILSNTATELTTVVAEKILQSMLGMAVEPIEFRKEVVVDPAVLQTYVGVYQLAPQFAITITLENGRLMLQATGQGKNEIFASSPTEFFLKVVDAQVSFEHADDGSVERLVLHQNGADVPGPRVKDAK